MKTGSAAIIRKGLVVLQFTVSIILIIATVIIFQQIEHVRSRNLGFNKRSFDGVGFTGRYGQTL